MSTDTPVTPTTAPPPRLRLTPWRLAVLTARGLVSDRRERREELAGRARDRRRSLRALDPRLRAPVFVLGAPRSGTTFLGSCIGTLPGVSYHFEPRVTKAAARQVFEGTWSEQRAGRLFRSAYGLLQVAAGEGGRRFVEKNPENCFIVPFLARTFPDARFVQIIRDGRDVAVSHAEKPWLSARSVGDTRRGRGGQAWGPWARWWVERDRAEEFTTASDLTRTAWSWRRFTEAAMAGLAELPADRVLTVRYEDVVQDPVRAAEEIGAFFGHATPPDELRAALLQAKPNSVGRWRTTLDADGLADVERESGALLRQLGYA
ncbi:sulfotransferase [Blastococcus jejuensis]|uniref:Sulfotransferase n=1 Tax=Blastococcus jejuensis TaxID=351224 RepID=A0ABP6P916_9ACTN